MFRCWVNSKTSILVRDHVEPYQIAEAQAYHFVIEPRLGSDGCSTSRLLSHLLRHFLFQLLCRGFRFVCPNHPSVSIGADCHAATIAPKHVRDLALGGCPETHGLCNVVSTFST